MQPRNAAAIVLMTLLAGAATASPAPADESLPPDIIVKRAIDAAGGYEAFSQLGLVKVTVTSEELAQAGKQTTSEKATYFMTPGPVPGRIEIPNLKVISGDDGSGGWATVAGKYDQRPELKIMVKRLLRTNLFSVLLPFTLAWDEVSVTGAVPMMVGTVPVWRLSVTLTPTFFHTPQIATSWTVDINRDTYAVVQAQSPATDLGRGIRADGMLMTWGKPQVVNGLTLAGEQRIVGLSDTGAEKTHNRVDKIRYELLDKARNLGLFSNPVPPDLRPTPPVGPGVVPHKTQ